MTALTILCHQPACGEEPNDTPPNNAEKAHLRAAERHMKRLELRRRDSDGEIIELVDHPLLSFGDQARQYQRGYFWAWGQKGRPVAFVEIWQNADQPELWRHAVTLSSSERLSLDVGSSGR